MGGSKAQASIEFQLSFLFYIFLIISIFFSINLLRERIMENTNLEEIEAFDYSLTYNLAFIHSLSFKTEKEVIGIGNSFYLKKNEKFIPLNIIEFEEENSYG